MIRLATVSPCYNEEEVLRHSTERLTALFERMIAEGLISDDSMMVFVNDGSRDRTWETIRELHRENKFVKGINMSRNVGHQNAIMAGMMTAREWADAIITIDADLQDDIECIPQMVRHFEQGNEGLERKVPQRCAVRKHKETVPVERTFGCRLVSIQFAIVIILAIPVSHECIRAFLVWIQGRPSFTAGGVDASGISRELRGCAQTAGRKAERHV